MTQSLLERTHLDTYVALTIIYAAIGWPIAHSWILGGGWLYQLGAVDFADGGSVSVLASLIGIIGTLMIGPRLGVFDNKLNIDQMGAIYKKSGETLNLVDKFQEQIKSKQEVFKQGYKPPSINRISFINTIDEQLRHQIQSLDFKNRRLESNEETQGQ